MTTNPKFGKPGVQASYLCKLQRKLRNRRPETVQRRPHDLNDGEVRSIDGLQRLVLMSARSDSDARYAYIAIIRITEEAGRMENSLFNNRREIANDFTPGDEEDILNTSQDEITPE